EKLAEFREFVISYGYKAGDLTNRTELQRLLASFSGKPEEQTLKIELLKSLRRARYATQPLGHYGLAKKNYTHFTSPIRRYADLIVHRTLAQDKTPGRLAKSSEQPSMTMERLVATAEHISDTERIAADAETDAVKMKKLEFFQCQLRAHNPQVFRASIIDVRNYGLVLELPDVLLTGLVHVSSLADDFYVFQSAQRELIGRQSRRRFRVGDELRVFVAQVDTFKGQVDFALVDETNKKRVRARR